VALTLIGGGSRSGKSRYALQLARKHGPRLVFLATAEPFDKEMEARIAQHRADRGADFTTVEEPIDIATVIRETEADAIVVDCLTLWLSNIMLSFGRDVDADIETLVEAAKNARAALVLVTNEVGCGIVPETNLGRDFRDRAGILNQRIAAVADEVYWMAFGCPLKLK
jgi:adenosylcobinamide kinase / adenosylcobinamide-phosphate guanylyltransferase